MLHDAFHVVVLLGFLATLGVAFIGLVTPLVFPERPQRPRAVKLSILLGLAATLAFASDWLGHQVF